MPSGDRRADTTVALTAGGVTVLLDVTGGRLPAILHWGAALPGLDDREASALVVALEPVVGSNTAVTVPRVSVLPEHHTGWTGRPGLRGSFAGHTWSPAFTVEDVTLDGQPVAGFVSGAAGLVETTAVDDAGHLRLRLQLELLESGVFRMRAVVGNLATETYALDDLVLALPVPAQATELLDFTGRHNLERVPRRLPFGPGLHLRENRK
jgi:alpha-galactosidase